MDTLWDPSSLISGWVRLSQLAGNLILCDSIRRGSDSYRSQPGHFIFSNKRGCNVTFNPQGFTKSARDSEQQLFGWKQVSWQPHSCFKVQKSCQCNGKTSLSLTDTNWHLPNDWEDCFHMCWLSTFGDNARRDWKREKTFKDGTSCIRQRILLILKGGRTPDSLSVSPGLKAHEFDLGHSFSQSSISEPSFPCEWSWLLNWHEKHNF
jgi:hypothetical protein